MMCLAKICIADPIQSIMFFTSENSISIVIFHYRYLGMKSLKTIIFLQNKVIYSIPSVEFTFDFFSCILIY